MKGDKIDNFFKEHKQSIEDDGFSKKLFERIDYIPVPAPKKVEKSKLIIPLFATLGLVLFVLLGGYDALIGGLGSMGSIFTDGKSIKPEVVVSVLFMAGSLVALGIYAADEG